MNRSEFQALAIESSEDAQILFNSGRYAGAYYISGYVIECGLKAVIARQTRENDFPPKDAAGNYTHDLTKFMNIAGLDAAPREKSQEE